MGWLGAMALGSGFRRLDFNLVAVREELGAEAEGFALQGEVDEVHGLPGLLLGGTMGDLAGVELKVEPADGDDFHGGVTVTGRQGVGSTASSSA